MFEKEKWTGADISIDYCGHKLQSPYILSSGPLTYGSEGMIKGFKAGCGAVVTKTIRMSAAINPVCHIGKIKGSDSLINCEKWADDDRHIWYEKHIPETVAAGAVVIGSVGHTLEEAKCIVKDVEKAGAHMIELVSYTVDTMLPMLDYTKRHVDIPVICKVSANWANTPEATNELLKHGADGICAIDSIGPTLKIDIEKARPEMMSNDGYGWLTGSAIKPIALRINADIAKANPDLHTMYASGGCMSADDAIEFLMAGAIGCGVCTAPMLKGTDYITKMCYDLSKRLKELGYNSINEVHRAALPNFPKSEYMCDLDFHFQPFKEDGSKKCISCKKCETVCCYDARTLEFPEMHVDRDKCRSCGLCVDICPTGALTAGFMAQTEKDLKKAADSKQFYADSAKWQAESNL